MDIPEGTISQLIRRFLVWREIEGYSPRTLQGNRYQFRYFADYLEEHGIRDVEGLTVERLRDFQEYLAFKTTKGGRFWSPGARTHVIAIVKMFLRWIKKEDFVAQDLSDEMKYPKFHQRLPRNILTVKEMEQILNAPDKTTHKGFRDALFMELLYETGIRLKEIRGLKLEDIETEQGYLHVREGKGGKDRVVPLGKGLCRMIEHYRDFVRPHVVFKEDSDYLFRGMAGPMSETHVHRIINRYREKTGIEKKVFPHAFRHACATHMLQNGAPLRHVQELLGHSRIDTTQIYTHVTINDLKKAHARFHPREKMMKDKEPRLGMPVAIRNGPAKARIIIPPPAQSN